jgi:hypothetical protein
MNDEQRALLEDVERRLRVLEGTVESVTQHAAAAEHVCISLITAVLDDQSEDLMEALTRGLVILGASPVPLTRAVVAGLRLRLEEWLRCQ